MNAAMAPAAQNAAGRVAGVRARIAEAAQRAGRDPADVTLVAISKTHGAEAIRPVLETGITDLGENRVQEAEEKVPALPAGITWHLVGHLQTNKINKALEMFALIHSVDSVRLGEAIARRGRHNGNPVRALLQVNIAAKPSQFGFGVDELADAAVRLAGVEGLQLEGLMCIAPDLPDVEQTRPYFQRLAALHRDLALRLRDGGHPWQHLSMGMTNDYPVAVEEGATLVRVGRAIFGERAPVPAGT